MSNQTEQLHEVEVSIESLKSKIEDLSALDRLAKNKDFNRIIDTGYFITKATEMVMAKASPSMQNPQDQEGILRSIDAIGELRQHFAFITQMGEMAKRSLADHELAREDILREDLQEVG